MMIIYKTQTSLFLKLLFIVILLSFLVISFLEKSIALFAVIISFSTVVLYILQTTHYTIHKNKLDINSGFFYKVTVNIETIRKVTYKRKNLLSGPGFSTNRLIIEYNGHNCVIISPRLKEAFLKHLTAINPAIEIIE